MDTYVYWNSNDLDCKKIFHFLSKDDADTTIIPQIDEHDIDRIEMPSLCDKEKIHDKIAHSDLIIFCTHGTKDKIMKYQVRDKHSEEDYVLLDEGDINILKGKNVIAFCCYSAKELGRKCVDNNICKSYVGFEGPIIYDTKAHEDAQKRHEIYVAYKKAFCDALSYGITNKTSAKIFKSVLEAKMKRMMVDTALNGKDRRINSIYSTTVDGLVVLGNEEEIMFA